MKRLLTTILTSCILTTALVSISTTGCKVMPSSPVAVAFLTLKDTWSLKDRAMKAYAIKAVKGELTDAQRAKVWKAHKEFTEAFDVALSAVSFNWNDKSPENVTVLVNNLITIINKL